MKKLNYYQVHKNKKPKRIFNKYKKPNLKVFKSMIIALKGIKTHALILATKFESIEDKIKAISENIVESSIQIQNVFKNN